MESPKKLTPKEASFLWISSVIKNIYKEGTVGRFVNALSGDFSNQNNDEKLKEKTENIIQLVRDFEEIRPKLENRNKENLSYELSDPEQETFTEYAKFRDDFDKKILKIEGKEISFKEFYNKVLEYIKLNVLHN